MARPPASPVDETALPSRTFAPTAGVVVGTLVTGLVFGVVLEFLVLISFLGQRLWRSPLLGTDLLFTLPFLVWVLVLAATAVGVLRVLTAWLHVDGTGYRLRALGRRTAAGTWAEVGRVVAVRDLSRAATTVSLPETAYDGVYLLDRAGSRLLAVSSRSFGPRAQEATLREARGAGVPTEELDAITAADLRERFPQALTPLERHPNLVVLLLAVFYVGHNVLTFAVWGL